MTRLGLQIPNFTYPGLPDARLFEQVAAIATQAEASGFDTVMVMDHFYQLPALGAPDQPMLEAYTLLGALAARTRRVRLATLVTGNTYRNPALLAKIVTTLDVISGGRAVLGIGAGWFEPEHAGYGFPFPLAARAPRPPRGGARDHPRDVPRRAAELRGPLLQDERGAERRRSRSARAARRS